MSDTAREEASISRIGLRVECVNTLASQFWDAGGRDPGGLIATLTCLLEEDWGVFERALREARELNGAENLVDVLVDQYGDRLRLAADAARRVAISGDDTHLIAEALELLREDWLLFAEQVTEATGGAKGGGRVAAGGAR